MSSIVIDTAFVLAAVAFFKAQFNLKGWYPILCALGVSAFLIFLPDLVALLPGSEYYVDKIINLIKLFLMAPGLFDLGIDVSGKIAAKVSQSKVIG